MQLGEISESKIDENYVELVIDKESMIEAADILH